MESKLANALAALSCLWKMALALTSSEVIVFLLLEDGVACCLEILSGAKLGMSELAP